MEKYTYARARGPRRQVSEDDLTNVIWQAWDRTPWSPDDQPSRHAARAILALYEVTQVMPE